MTKHYYAVSGVYGLNFAYDGALYDAFRFDSKAQRDAWVDHRPEKREAVTCKIALRVLGAGKYDQIVIDADGRMTTTPAYYAQR